jgi:KDO2-lipid IV(A) lauroyltransferase
MLPDDAALGRRLGPAQKALLCLVLALARLLRLLGYRGLALLARLAGFCFWRLGGKRRRFAVASIECHLGVDHREACRIARLSFNSNFLSFLEILLAPAFSIYGNPRLIYPPAFGELAVSKDRPILAVTCHLGAWELMAGMLGQFRPEYPSLVAGRNQRSDLLTVFIHRLRSTGNSASVGHRNIAGLVSRTLRDKGTVAFVVDHNSSRDEAIFLPFLGEIASVNIGPAMLALRSKALVMPIFLKRLAPGRYELVLLDCLDSATLTGSIRERTAQIAEFYTRAAETFVRQTPEQWFWMHNRWKTKPSGWKTRQPEG